MTNTLDISDALTVISGGASPDVLTPADGFNSLNSVLGKCFAMLDVLSVSSTGRLRLSEIARESGIPKATAYRILRGLLSYGVLQKNGNFYSLGMRVFELAYSVSDLQNLRQAAMPFLADLHVTTGEVVHLGVLDQCDVLYLDKLAGAQSVSTPTATGRRMPAHCTALGKALLAFSDVKTIRELVGQPMRRRTGRTIVAPLVLTEELREIRRMGVAIDRDEAVIGLSCVASPVIVAGRAIAAISITTPSTSSRFREDALRNAVRSAAAKMAGTPAIQAG